MQHTSFYSPCQKCLATLLLGSLLLPSCGSPGPTLQQKKRDREGATTANQLKKQKSASVAPTGSAEVPQAIPIALPPQPASPPAAQPTPGLACPSSLPKTPLATPQRSKPSSSQVLGTTPQPSTSQHNPAPPAASRLKAHQPTKIFTAAGGKQVEFKQVKGQWQARVTEQLGAFSRVMELPVFCERHGDIEAALLDLLQADSDMYARQRIHMLPTKPHPDVSPFVYLGALGLKGGGGEEEPPSKRPKRDREATPGLPGPMEADVSRHLSPERAQGLLGLMREHPEIDSMAQVPVYLQALHTCWQADEAGVREETKRGSLSGLYGKLTGYMEQDLPNEEREAVFDFLGELAWGALQHGAVLMSLEEVRSPRVAALLQESGLLLQEGSQYRFPGPAWRAYWAGRWVAKQWLSGAQQAELQQFISEHKYERQYARMLSFLAGELSREQGVEGIRQLLRLLEAEPREVVGVQHVLLQMQLMNEWLCIARQALEKDLADLEGEFHVLGSFEGWFRAGLEQVRGGKDRKLLEVLTTALASSRAVVTHASELLEPPQAAFRDRNCRVRSAAFEALVAVAKAAPELAPKLLEPLQAAFKDSDAGVRRAALEALGEVVKVAPELAPEALEPLLKACQGSDRIIRRAALWTFGVALTVVPAEALRLLEPLLVASQDKDAGVRRAALEALGEVVKVAPELAPVLLEHLLVASQDKDADARRAALWAFGVVAKVAPELAPVLLEHLLVASQDKDADARRAALWAFEEVAKVAPELTPKLLEPLLKASQDKDAGVRRAALWAFGAVAKAAPELAPRLLEPLLKASQAANAGVHGAALEALVAVFKAASAKAPRLRGLLIAASQNKDAGVRRAALEALREIVQAVPAEAPALLEPLLKASQDVDYDIRSAAFSAFVAVVQAAPELAPKLLEPLLKASQDKARRVRSVALPAFVAVAKATPELAPVLLESLQAASQDSDAGVRRAALWALGEVVQAAPAEAPALRRLLIATSQDSDAGVRRAALWAFGEVVQAAPAEAPVLRGLLIAASQDSDAGVRRAALEAFGEALKAAPTKFPRLLQPLLKASQDKDAGVRRAAFEALVAVDKAVPELAPVLLKFLQAASQRKNAGVRQAALEALGQLSLLQLIESYWITQNQALIPLMVDHLYHTPLLVQTIPNKPAYQQLVLCPTAGQPVAWDKPQQEVERLVQRIQRAAQPR